MENISIGEYADVVSALVAALSLLAPMLYTWLKQKAQLDNTEYYLDNLKMRKEIQSLLTQHPANKEPIIHSRLSLMLNQLELEIQRVSLQDVTMRPYYFTVFFEVLLLMMLWMTGSSWHLNHVFEASSAQSGIGFFEGILQAPAVRWLLAMVNVVSAVFLTHFIMRKLQDHFDTAWALNLSAVAVFHVTVSIFITLSYLLLMTLDSYLTVF